MSKKKPALLKKKTRNRKRRSYALGFAFPQPGPQDCFAGNFATFKSRGEYDDGIPVERVTFYVPWNTNTPIECTVGNNLQLNQTALTWEADSGLTQIPANANCVIIAEAVAGGRRDQFSRTFRHIPPFAPELTVRSEVTAGKVDLTGRAEYACSPIKVDYNGATYTVPLNSTRDFELLDVTLASTPKPFTFRCEDTGDVEHRFVIYVN